MTSLLGAEQHRCVTRLVALGASGAVLLLALWVGYGMSPTLESVPSADDLSRAAELSTLAERLKVLHRDLEPPEPGDWLDLHDEPGQTFEQYLRCRPVLPRGQRTVIYIQPLGSFSSSQQRVVDLTAEFLGIFFGLEVKVQKRLALDIIPPRARRTHPQWGDRQIHSGYVLTRVLKRGLPRDAAARIALTSSDLWPGDDWNFVFGQASLRERVGVWSLYRNGDPAGGLEAFRECLLRTVKTASHETGHMFSMRHCTAYDCSMCGSNSREESDRRPLWLCPECWCKVVWAAGVDPVDRFAKLREFCRRTGLPAERDYYDRALAVLRQVQPGASSAAAPLTGAGTAQGEDVPE